ncbi:hypothetical protein [Enterobacter hormaechei]|uniref:hypothetical protein n=1 Tax=Enterobacter hormaechei TaxID=158836 RepID=UPI0005F8D061|nr:hypothetical protein [Enterobacter hormaechei]KJX48462.1 hypothetical protein SG79_01325 [Enterobacter hormaechei subsp. xiangfangensis]
MDYRDSLGFWLSMLVVDYLLAFVIALFCMFSGVDVAEWGRVIIACVFAPLGITMVAFVACQISRK